MPINLTLMKLRQKDFYEIEVTLDYRVLGYVGMQDEIMSRNEQTTKLHIFTPHNNAINNLFLKINYFN